MTTDLSVEDANRLLRQAIERIRKAEDRVRFLEAELDRYLNHQKCNSHDRGRALARLRWAWEGDR